MDLLSKGNTKVLKTNKRQTGYSMKIMHLSPADSSGFGNTCGKESEGCASSCFRNSGHFLHKNVRAAHDYKTEWFFKDNFTFRAALQGECSMHQYDSENVGMTPVVRLNGTSDIAWEEETPDIFEQCKDTQFLDYTKHLSRMIRFLSGELPENYYLTFSRSEDNWMECVDVLDLGGNVAVVFEELPKTYGTFEVIDGDEHDLRFLDDRPRIVGLLAKGKARKDMTGFRVRKDMLPEGYEPFRTPYEEYLQRRG